MEGTETEGKKFILEHGIHRGTLTSRDSDVAEYGTREEALADFKKQTAFYHSIGYVIWYATLHHPDGTKEKVAPDNTNYR